MFAASSEFTEIRVEKNNCASFIYPASGIEGIFSIWGVSLGEYKTLVCPIRYFESYGWFPGVEMVMAYGRNDENGSSGKEEEVINDFPR